MVSLPKSLVLDIQGLAFQSAAKPLVSAVQSEEQLYDQQRQARDADVAQAAEQFKLPSISEYVSSWGLPSEPVRQRETPSGTPAAMPSNAPRTGAVGSSTITTGDQSPALRPGESVGSVTLGDAPHQPTSAGGDIDNSSRESFVRTAYPYMLQAAGGDANLAELMLAKAISENGSIGTGKPFWANNFSGIKGEGDAGSVEADTWEDYGNGRVNIKDKFAAYSTPQKGMAAFMDFLRNNSRYAPALQRYQQTGNSEQLFDDILAAGYATDKNWANNVRSIRDSQVRPVVRQTAGGARQSLNAGSGLPAPESAPAVASSPPPAGNGSELWSPDGQVLPPGPAFQASAGRGAGQGVMMRQGLSAPAEVGNGEQASTYQDPDTLTYPAPPTYNDPDAGGTITQPLPTPDETQQNPTKPDISSQIVDGRTVPPTPGGDYRPVQTVPNPQKPPAADPATFLAEDSQSQAPEPYSPYGAPRDPVASADGSYAPPAYNPPARPDAPRQSTGQVQAMPGEADYVPTRAGNPVQRTVEAVQRGIQRSDQEMDDPGLTGAVSTWIANRIRPLVGKGPVENDREFLEAPAWLPAPIKDALTTASQAGFEIVSGSAAANIAEELWTEFVGYNIPIGSFEVNPGSFLVPNKWAMGGMQANTNRMAQTASQRALGQAAVDYNTGVAGAIENAPGRAFTAARNAAAPYVQAGREAVSNAADALGRGAARALPEGEMQLGSGFVPSGGNSATRAPQANALPHLPPEATAGIDDAVLAVRARRTPEQEQLLIAAQESAEVKMREQARIKAEMQGADTKAINAEIKRQGATLTKTEEAARIGFTGQEEVADVLREGQVVPAEAVAGMLGQYPKYLNGVVDFIMEQREKLVSGTLAPREVAKALVLTVGSMQSGAMGAEKLRPSFGQRIKKLFIDDGKVRPEEAIAAWFLTARGRRALDSLESGKLTQKTWEDLLTLRDAYGNNTLRNMGVFVPMDRTTKQMQWAAPVPRYRDGTPKQYDLRNLGELTEAINATRGDPEALQAVVSRIKGIGAAKPGFVKHLLGFGEEATFDAVEMNLWIAGAGDTGKLTGPASDFARAAKLYSDNPEVTTLLFDQIRGRFRELRQAGVGADIDEGVYNHILHHWIWDKAKGLQTTHAGMYEAMRHAAGADIEPGGLGLRPSMSDARNAAQGGVIGAASEIANDEELSPEERLARIGAGAALGVAAGRSARGRTAAGQRLGAGFVADSGPTPRSRMNMEDIASRAEEVLGVKPDEVKRWQTESLNEPAYTRSVRGAALQQAANIDEDAAMRAIDRLEAAQSTARASENLGDIERLDVADAVLEAAEAAQAMRTSRAASTAEGRATARALAQRRQAIVARQGVVSAERAKSVGQDAAFAANAVKRIERTGQMSSKDEQLLRTLQDKLREAEKHGLVDDGAGGRLEAIEQRAAMFGPDGKRKLPAWTELVTEAAERRMTPEMRAAENGGGSRGPDPWMRAAVDLGNSMMGAGVGGTAGYMAPADSDEERIRNARIGAGAGAIGYPVAGRFMRRPTGALSNIGPMGNRAERESGSTRGRFGLSPTPDMPNRAVAMGSDPSKRYTFAYRVVDLDDLVTSHTPGGSPNPAFPQELQPRDRGRAASMQQVDRIAQSLSPDALLFDAGRLDSGPMIVGPDRVVESGNGRTLALRRAADQYPEQYGQYVESMRQNLSEYGLDETALAGKQRPVLVRERLSDVDRAAFAAEANNSGLLRMSAFEQAAQDAGNLSDDLVSGLTVSESDTIASALRRTDNREQIRSWVGTLPANEQAGVIDAAGNLSAQGYERLTNALLMKTYGEDAGARLVRAFVESADPTVRNVQTALLASLPDVARAEAMIRAGTRDASLSIAGDMAAAVDMLARLRREGMKPSEYLAQSAMFERELTPFQESLLGFLDANNRKPSALKNGLKQYAERVESTADPSQVSMFGDEIAPPTREELWQSAVRDIDANAPTIGPLFEADQAAVGVRADGAGLAPAAPAAPTVPQVTPEPPAARPAPQPVRQRAHAPRPPHRPIEPIAPTGGPEGRLEVQGAPQPMPRPGPVESIAPRGGPEGTLAVEGAPVRSPRPGPVADIAPRGGPEGTLRAPGTPEPLVRPTRAAPMDAPAGGPEGTLRRSLTDQQRADDRMLEQSRIRGVVQQIDEVLANPRAPGSVERLQQLRADLTEISQAGFARSSDIKKRLQRNGLLRAGLASKTEDVDGLVQALARTDPSKPEEMRAILQIISKPRLIDKILEYQYVNMLSSPVTQGVNILSNVAQLSGRLLLQNPLEYVYSGGRSTGVASAFQGAGRGFQEALGEAGQIMKTGVSSKNMERAAELGDYGHVNREALTEQFGKAGAALHFISTRPLQAMDALLGNMAYASAAEQYAQRTADRLLKNGSETVKGMSREEARAHVMSNIWDYPEVIEKAGKISDYTLLKTNDAKGLGYGNRAEAAFRRFTSLGRPTEGDGFVGQSAAFLFNQALPFTNVPLNFAKQGAERTVGVPYNAVRAAGAYGRGETERGAELAAKATIGAGALTAGIAFAWGDNLTGEGPTDAGQRKVWEQTHKRNSFRFGKDSPWISWEGTPWAIPFGMIAGAKENAGESIDRAAKKGESDPTDLALSIGGGTVKGAWQGFASQSFIKSLGQQYELLTGDQTGLGAVAASMAGTASRFIPAGSMFNFLARVGDEVERDPGKPQQPSEVMANVGDRLSTRVPKFLGQASDTISAAVGFPGAAHIRNRGDIDSKLDIYGEDTPNEQAGWGSVPYYRGRGPQAGDPITQAVEKSGVGAPAAPDEVSIPKLPGAKIPLNNRERRVFQQAYGRAYRENLEAAEAGRGDLPPIAVEKLRSLARDAGENAVLAAIGPDEIQRRLSARQTAGVR